MQFKVGDRVEVLAPAEGVGDWDKNDIGYGTVERVSTDASGSVQIKVDANDCAWWYKLGKVRLVRPVNEPTPTPSITVGTQVRLTGVVTGRLDKEVVWVTSNEYAFPIPEGALEVIRQPFKRGEVVKHKTVDADDCVVIDDEANGRVLLVVAREGVTTFEMPADLYERLS